MAKKNVYTFLASERNKQNKKWGEQNHHLEKWLAILVEEVGEAAELVNELNPAVGEISERSREVLLKKLRDEIIQVGAVAVAWFECIERGKKNG